MSETEILIALDNPSDHVYIPGSSISGKAFFTPKFNARLRSLEIVLRGECYTSSLGRQAKVANVVPFLEITSKLLAAVYTYRGETYEAPFDFTFPTESSLEQPAGPEVLMPLFRQDKQPLPSSFVLSMKNTLQCVRYYIHVHLNGRTPAVAEKTVLFRQAQPPVVPDELKESPILLHPLPLQSTLQRIWQERLRDARAKGESKNMQWFIKPWKTPRIIFMPSMYMPTTVAIGQVIPLYLSVDGIRNPMWKDDKTSLRLAAFTVKLTAHTRTIMHNRPTKSLSCKYGRCLELPYTVLDARELRHPIEVDGDPIPLLANFKILPATIPSFKTYTINRSYTVDIHLTFRTDGEILHWVASLALEITPSPDLPFATGANMDALLFTNPRHSPEYFWNTAILAGTAESTMRHNVYPAFATDAVNLPNSLAAAGPKLPRSSFACAEGLLAGGLHSVDGVGKNRALSVVASKRGVTKRKWLRGMETVVQPLVFES